MTVRAAAGVAGRLRLEETVEHTIEGLLVRLRSGEQVRLRVPEQQTLEDVVATLESACSGGGAVTGFRPNGDYVVVPTGAIDYMEIVLAERGSA
jgi:hypothetical protein